MKRLLGLLAFFTLPLAAQEYKIAVIGLVHGHTWGYLSKMVEGKTARLVGVAEKEPELVANARKLGVADSLIYSDYVKMLDETKPDIVWGFVENNRHLEIVKACAPRKINVIFEKPLASTYQDALEIRKLATQYGIRVMTNYQMAWWPANYAAKAFVDAGSLGKPWRLHGIVGHGGPGGPTGLNKYFFNWLTDPEQNGGGALMDFGCYNALWSLWYLGKPEKVFATANHLRPETFPKVEDNADIVLYYKNGVGIFEASWDLPHGYQDLEIFGLGGSVYMKNGSAEVHQGTETKQLDLVPLAPAKADPLSFMTDALRNNKPIEGLTAMDINVEVIHIIEAAKESVRTGRAVPFQ